MTTPLPRPRRGARCATVLSVAGAVLAGCAPGGASSPTGNGTEVTINNCDTEETFPSPAERIYVNDGNMTAMLLALGAEDRIAAVSGLRSSTATLESVYGSEVVDDLPIATDDYPTTENVIAQRPDVMVAGWNYGYREEDKLTPDSLRDRGIAPYVLSESCRRADGTRGTMPPWEALYADLDNLGAITGREDEADELVTDIRDRVAALEEAPQAEEPPTVFLFDSGTKEIFTSGSFGGPQAIIEAAGAENATADVEDTWTAVSWERLVAAEPDYFAFVDYEGQSFEDKVEVLESNPATRDLAAVKEERYLNLPIAAWTSSPLNIDAAEQLRVDLEEHGLVPRSDIAPTEDLKP